MLPKALPGWHVYLLECGDGSLYCGITNDITRRISRHNNGKGGRYTRSRIPVKLVAKSPPMSRSAALSFEAKVKKSPRDKKARMVKAG